MRYVNLETMPYAAYKALTEYDRANVGTDRYLGLAYFWSGTYKYPMREVNASARRRIHDAFMHARLHLDGSSAAHAAIISNNLTRTDRKYLDACYGGDTYRTKSEVFV